MPRYIDADAFFNDFPELRNYEYASQEYEVDTEPKEIGYEECSNALLKMWMDNLMTDSDYYRIAKRLYIYWKERRDTAVVHDLKIALMGGK